MRTRFSRAFFATAAMAAVSLATGLAIAGPASAAPAAPAASAGGKATVQCLTLLDCDTLRQYDPTAAAAGLAMQISSFRGSTPIVVYPNDGTSFLQDWTYIDLGTVNSYNNGGIEPWGLTAFDFANYGTDHLYEVEFSPAGIPTGYCAGNASNVLLLRSCNGSKYQTYIAAASVLGNTAHTGFFYYLSLAQVPNGAHHYALTGSLALNTGITFKTVGYYVTQWWQPVHA